ncbi:MAG: site-2 protease family protein [Opitutaceae bacterium]|nr:site-2 protease family protein [Cytophagales bacterium]
MKQETKTLIIQLSLFIVTIITTTLAGTEWQFGRLIFDNSVQWLNWDKILKGLYFSIPFLGILTVHEFGHYFVAKKHKVDVSLPYYIPFWTGLFLSIGTMGAFIRIKTRDLTNKQYFDIGIAGPLAGFVAALIVLFYGFTHLPSKEYIFTIFPEFLQYGHDYVNKLPSNWEVIYLGDNLLFTLFEKFVADPSLIPPHYELMHHPILFAGYLSLFFTSMNLLPIGQLDGGHILYGLVGHKKHALISKGLFILFISFAGIGILNPLILFEEMIITLPLYLLFLYSALNSSFEDKKNRLLAAVVIASLQFLLVLLFPSVEGYHNWLFFGFVIGRFLGVNHPQAEVVKIDNTRKLLGWFSLVVFFLCFSPQPFSIN